MNANVVMVDFSKGNQATEADASALSSALQEVISRFGEREFAQAMADQSDVNMKAAA